MGDVVIDKTIENPIEQRNTARGNPNAVLQFGEGLNNRQEKMLKLLEVYDSKIVVNKNHVNMKDLAALTAHTGDEFAMFTKGNERLVIRGDAVHVNINYDTAKQMASEGWRWSGHTHPGYTNYLCGHPTVTSLFCGSLNKTEVLFIIQRVCI